MASGTIYGTTSNQFIVCMINWSSTPDTDNNKSTVTAHQYYRRTNTGYITQSDGHFDLSINGVNNHRDAFTTVGSDWVWVNSCTVVVEHNSDGTLSIPISCGGYIGGSSLTDTYCGGTAVLDTIPRASAISHAKDVLFDQMVEVKWTPLSINFHYKVKVVFGSWSYESAVISPGNLDEYTFSECSIPSSTATQIPNSKSGSASVTLVTYSDGNGEEQIGDAATTQFNVTLPSTDETNPTLQVTIAPVNSLPASFQDLYIQGKSKLKATLTANGRLGATIIARYFAFQGAEFDEDDDFTTGFLFASGDFTISAYAIDSRGFITKVTKTFTVLPYSKPQIQNASVQRCDSSGNIADSGTYLKISASQVYSSVSGRNHGSIYYRYRTENGSYGQTKLLLANGDAVVSSALEEGSITVENSYFVEILSQDKIGESGSATIMVPTAKVYEHEAGSIGSYGFGKYVTDPDTFDIDSTKTLKVRGTASMEKANINALSAQTLTTPRATGLTGPGDDSDAANKAYVDAKASEAVNEAVATGKKYADTKTSMTLLWENASPTSDFPEQRLSLPLEQGSAVVIHYKHYRTNEAVWSMFCPVGKVSCLQSIYGDAFLVGNIQNAIRHASVEKTGITFSGGFVSTSGGALASHSGVCVPVSIYVIKGVSA